MKDFTPNVDGVVRLHGLVESLLTLFRQFVDWNYSRKIGLPLILKSIFEKATSAETLIAELILDGHIRPVDLEVYSEVVEHSKRSVFMWFIGYATNRTASEHVSSFYQNVFDSFDENKFPTDMKWPDDADLQLEYFHIGREMLTAEDVEWPSSLRPKIESVIRPYRVALKLLIERQSDLAVDKTAPTVEMELVVSVKKWLKLRSRDMGPTSDQLEFVNYLLESGLSAIPADVDIAMGKHWQNPRDSVRQLVKLINKKLVAGSQPWRLVAEDRGEVVIVSHKDTK